MLVMRYLNCVLFIILFFGCSKSKYHFEEANFDLVEDVTLDKKSVISNNLLFSYPSDMICIGDYIIVLAPNDSPSLFIYDKNKGELINNIVRKGKGPNELLQVNSIAVRFSDNESLGIYDNMSSKIHIYSYEMLSDTSLNCRPEIIDVPRIDNSFTNIVSHIDDKMLVRTNCPDKRLLWIEKDKSINIAKEDFPILYDEDLHTNANVLSYANKTAISPDGNKIVETTYLGGIIEILERTGSEYKQKILHTYTEPKFEFYEYPDHITWSDETMCGFKNLSVTEKSIIAQYDGKLAGIEDKNETKLRVYDWNGDQVKEYRFDINFWNFTYDKSSNSIFAIVVGESGNFELYKYNLEIE